MKRVCIPISSELEVAIPISLGGYCGISLYIFIYVYINLGICVYIHIVGGRYSKETHRIVRNAGIPISSKLEVAIPISLRSAGGHLSLSLSLCIYIYIPTGPFVSPNSHAWTIHLSKSQRLLPAKHPQQILIENNSFLLKT